MTRACLIAASLLLLAATLTGPGRAEPVPLPAGVRAVWDLSQAYRETTQTRERVCLNGLWRWQPAGSAAEAAPSENWGYFKVPGAWPGLQDWLQKDCQTVFAHPSWKDTRLADLTAAWYQREFTVPASWTGRRLALATSYLNSYAAVYIDGRRLGDLRFPGGEVDLTAACAPGKTCTLSLLVVAMPLKATLLTFGNTQEARQVAGSVARRGLCGDVFLASTPAGPRLGDVALSPSVRRWELTVGSGLEGLTPGAAYTLEADISDAGKRAVLLTSKPFTAADLRDGRFSFTSPWHPDKLWDTLTPQNLYETRLSLRDTSGQVLDSLPPAKLGFRELWIDGRDFYLNGTRLYLSAVPLDNAQIGALWATYEGAKESLLRLKSLGINFVYTHNYDCQPGTHLSFEEILRAADDTGMLVALTQPHFAQYDWQAPDADQSNGYARHARFYVQAAQNHPSVVAYSTSHNSTGYAEAMNPDNIDGVKDPRESWAKGNAARALRAEGIIRSQDPSRIVYHHSSGNLGSMHTNNFYANFTPPQELCDWFEHWATEGVKPQFLCEFGAPLSWDFTMYRGWYQGTRTFGSAVVPWELCLAEWNSQFFGDKAFDLTEVEKACLRFEAKRFASGELWHRWDYPYEIGSRAFLEQYPAAARAITDEWRAFRTWGVSATNAWEYMNFFAPREGLDKRRRDLPVDWQHLQRPGFSPDYLDARYERMDLVYDRDDWKPTPTGEAFMRNNRPLLAYLAGKASAFTEKGHNFSPGETLDKQLIVINSSREPVTAQCAWSLDLPQPLQGNRTVTVAPGQQERLPLRFELPRDLPAGGYALKATCRFSTGETQEDAFALDVPAPQAFAAPGGKIALFDPAGETTKLLQALGVACTPLEAGSDLAPYSVLIVGKAALAPTGPAPDLGRVRDGLRVIVFEQTAEALEQRLGFRVTEYGLRQAFPRVPDHPLLAGLTERQLHDWRGEATLLPPRLKYTMSPTYRGVSPTVRWAGLEVPHIWRCGNRGNVASVLIEKPACGDFLPIIDGGYSLQYSPLLQYREGRGTVLFCQLDVTGRTESDPAAERIVRALLTYSGTWQPAPAREALYVGEEEGRRHLARTGLRLTTYAGGAIGDDRVVVAGPGAAEALGTKGAAVAAYVKAGGRLVAVGSDDSVNALLPSPVSLKVAEHISCIFAPPAAGSPFAGIGPADIHVRAPRELPLVTGGEANRLGDGILAASSQGNVVFYQYPPYRVTRAQGAAAGFTVDDGEALEGKQSALISMGSAMGTGGQFIQAMKTGAAAGETYTFAASVKAVGEPVTLHLEVERAGKPWDRAVKAPEVTVTPDRWQEIHVTFTPEKSFTEGWQAYLACAQDGGRFRADMLRLYKGDYTPWQPGSADTGNMLANAGFESGAEPWRFSCGEQYNLRRTFRRSSYTLTRLLANQNAAFETPLLQRFASPAAATDHRWLTGLYLDEPVTWDDPYRFFCW